MPGTVSVGCKLPNGLHLNIDRMVKMSEAVMGGGVREVERAVPVSRVTVRGSVRKSESTMAEVLCGYGITHGVDAETWDRWLAVNKDSDVVRKGLIFAHAKQADVTAQAKAGESIRSGFEAVDPQSLPPEFKRKIETATAAA